MCLRVCVCVGGGCQFSGIHMNFETVRSHTRWQLNHLLLHTRTHTHNHTHTNAHRVRYIHTFTPTSTLIAHPLSCGVTCPFCRLIGISLRDHYTIKIIRFVYLCLCVSENLVVGFVWELCFHPVLWVYPSSAVCGTTQAPDLRSMHECKYK